MKNRARKNAGFTLLETLIAMILMILVMAGPIQMFAAAREAQRDQAMAADLERTAQDALARIADRLQPTDPKRLFTVTGYHQVDFQSTVMNGGVVVNGVQVGGVFAGGPVERILLESPPSDALDGVDNDGDGLVDERRIVWIEDPGGANERRATLCNWVAQSLEGEIANNGLDDNGNVEVDEPGLTFVDEGNGVRVLLTLERVAADGTRFTRTFERRIAFRNRDDTP